VKIKRKVSKEARPAAAPAGRAMAAPQMPRAEQHPAAGRKSVDSAIAVDAVPYALWKEWHSARERGDWEFVYELAAEGSQLREQFGDRATFAETCRRKLRPVAGSRAAVIARLRMQGDDEAFLFQAIDLEERAVRNYTVERWWMLRGPNGWRVHRIDEMQRAKDQSVNTIDNAAFPATVPPADFVALRDARDAERKAARREFVTAWDANRAAQKAAASAPAAAAPDDAPASAE
jgi:hypothetical protein